MLRTKNIITHFEEVDEAWAFQFYLGLQEKLEGQEIETFTPIKRVDGQVVEERTPSFFIFYDKRYFFKCYSTGNGGDIYEMVRLKFGYKTKAESVDRVWKDYQKYLNSNNLEYTLHTSNSSNYKEHKRFKIVSYDFRSWNEYDKRFWGKYFIGTTLLEKYFVRPLKTIHLSKTENGQEFKGKIERPLLYGYFKKDGTLYKIYQPGNTVKYLKVIDYMQGTEQLSLDRPNLLITKSLKDIMGFTTLQLDTFDSISPESENALIPKEVMAMYKRRYKSIITLFDQDSAGERATLLYKEFYGLESASGALTAKDITDNLESQGYAIVKKNLEKLLLS